MSDTAPSTLNLNKDLPALPLALGATDHLTGNVIPISIHWPLTGAAGGRAADLVLENAAPFKAATATRPSAQILGDITVSMSLRPSETATVVFASVCVAAVPDSHGKVATLEALMTYPGHVVLTATLMGGSSRGVLGLFPGAQRNLKISGALGEGFRLQAVAYTVGVVKVDLSITFSCEVQGWTVPPPETVVPF